MPLYISRYFLPPLSARKTRLPHTVNIPKRTTGGGEIVTDLKEYGRLSQRECIDESNRSLIRECRTLLRTFVFPALTLRNRLRSRLPSQAVQPLAKWLGRTQLIPRISAKNRPAPCNEAKPGGIPTGIPGRVSGQTPMSGVRVGEGIQRESRGFPQELRRVGRLQLAT